MAHSNETAVFQFNVEDNLGEHSRIWFTGSLIGLENLHYFASQSETKPLLRHSRFPAFSRAWSWSHVLTSARKILIFVLIFWVWFKWHFTKRKLFQENREIIKSLPNSQPEHIVILNYSFPIQAISSSSVHKPAEVFPVCSFFTSSIIILAIFQAISSLACNREGKTNYDELTQKL